MKYLLLILLVCAGCSKDIAKPTAAITNPPKDHHAIALLEKHCCRCHNPDKKKGKLDLQSILSKNAPLSHTETWETAMSQAENSIMPPEGKKQPTLKERKIMVEWLQGSLKKTYMMMPDDPGKTLVRKLNRGEYRETVKDLLYIDNDLAIDIPLDSVGYGFDNISELLSIPPLLMEKYMIAARKAVNYAILNGTGSKKSFNLPADVFTLPTTLGQKIGDSMIIWASGTAKAPFKTTISSKYKVTFKGWGDQAGRSPVKVNISIDNRVIKSFDVKNKKYNPGEFSVVVPISKGNHTLSISFTNDYYDKANKLDRNFYFNWATIEGPLTTSALSQSHKQLISMTPNSSISEDQAAIANITKFLKRAFRSKISSTDVDRYFALFKKIRKKDQNFEYSLKTTFVAALVSPRFLFRMESKPSKITKASDHELANRLSYFLHSSMPGEKLLFAADQGKLSNSEVFKSHAYRLLNSSKINNLSSNFAGQWLQLRSLDRLKPDLKLYPEWNTKLKDSMKKEAILLFNDILKNNLPIFSFINHSKIHLNETLAKHYNIDGIKGDNFRQVQAKNGRGGILTMASTLTVTSMPARTSPVKRGKWVMEEILGAAPPPPPANVASLEETAKINPNLSLKEKLELHREDDICASCHKTMDAIGFCFENYDALGKWRDKYKGKAVDAGGVLPDGTVLDTPANLKKHLESKKEKFVEHMISKLLTYALGRGLEVSDRKTIFKIMDKTRAKDFRFKDIIIAVTESMPFQYKKPVKK